jgi:hypothetical protein
MKTAQDIEQELVQEFVSRNDTVTFLGIGGVIRGIFTSVALKLRELWNDTTQVKRKLFIDTCFGQDLDNYAAEKGIVRNGETSAGALLLFKGTAGTIISSGTIIYNPTSKAGYLIKETIEIGAVNPGFVQNGLINLSNTSLGDVAWAESLVPGTKGKCYANQITEINIDGVTATNPAPTVGGKDRESDDEFKYRIKNYVKLLSQDTTRFYEALCYDLDNRILRIKPMKDGNSPDAVKIIIVTKNGVPLSDAELGILTQQIESSQKTYTKVTCVNIQFTIISIEMRVKLKPINNSGTVDFDLYYVNMADIISKLFDWSKYNFGPNIKLEDSYAAALTCPQTNYIDLQTFKMNGSIATNINLNSNSLPYFQSLKITDMTARVTKYNEQINQKFYQTK